MVWLESRRGVRHRFSGGRRLLGKISHAQAGASTCLPKWALQLRHLSATATCTTVMHLDAKASLLNDSKGRHISQNRSLGGVVVPMPLT